MSNTLYSDSADEPGQSPLADDTLDTPKTSENNGNGNGESKKKTKLFPNFAKRLFRKTENDIREALADYMEDSEDDDSVDYIVKHERDLISNVLKLRDLTVYDVMIPRVDIVALNVDSEYADIVEMIRDKQHSRIPVYKENLDNTIGFVHLKDILTCTLNGETFDITQIVRDIPILAPSLPVIDLLMQMKQTKQHIAMVIDEYGGIDGLVTIEDITEAIVGEISDEFDAEEDPEIVFKDSTIIADARVYLDDLIEETGIQLGDEEELEDIDTLGGYITNKIGRVPARGEVLRDRKNAIIFEIIDADPRRIKRVRIKKTA